MAGAGVRAADDRHDCRLGPGRTRRVGPWRHGHARSARRRAPKIHARTAQGNFVFPNLAPDTYTFEVVLSGFKTMKRSGVTVSPGRSGDRAGAGARSGRARGSRPGQGGVAAHSGELRRAILHGRHRGGQNLPIQAGRFTQLAALAPGVTGTTRIGDRPSTGGGDTNVQMDGVSTMDTGSNRAIIDLNVESIAEVKVLVSSYQAEYGRSSGLQITAVTKSGTNRFRGSLYDVERNSDWNANSRTNC